VRQFVAQTYAAQQILRRFADGKRGRRKSSHARHQDIVTDIRKSKERSRTASRGAS